MSKQKLLNSFVVITFLSFRFILVVVDTEGDEVEEAVVVEEVEVETDLMEVVLVVVTNLIMLDKA